jgi:general secretion pathway protein D
MRTPRTSWILRTLAGIALSTWFATEAGAQQRSNRSRSAFGGSAGGGSSGSSATEFNPNGEVGNATISVDPDTRNVTVVADEETTKRIAEVVASLDRPQPQVLIKVVFLELTHNSSLDLGVEMGWTKFATNVQGNVQTQILANAFGLGTMGQPANSNTLSSFNVFNQPVQSFQAISPFTSAGAGLYQILGTDFQATLRAIAAAGKAEMLSRPSVLARNNQPASILVGQNVPLITSVRYDTFGNAINSVSYSSVGIILKVTPFISSGNLVQMMVSPQISSVDPTMTVPISAGVSAPVIDIRSADTVVVTPDGQTVVIGGLMENAKSVTETKVPLLGDIPLIGFLFRRKVESGAKKELLIFLTPHVIEAPADLAKMTEMERKRSLTPKSYSEAELDRFLDKMPVKRSSK